MSATLKRELGMGEDPRILSTRLEAVEEGRLVGVWLNQNECAVIGLLEDRVDFQTLENTTCEDDFIHRILNSINGAEHIAVFGSDALQSKLTQRLKREKHLEKKLLEGGHCVALPKAQMIAHMQKFFDQHKATRSQVYNEQSRSLLE